MSSELIPCISPQGTCANFLFLRVFKQKPLSISLQELNVSHCLNVTDEGIQSVVTQCQRLSILVSHGCPLLTNLSRDIASNGRRLKQITWTVY